MNNRELNSNLIKGCFENFKDDSGASDERCRGILLMYVAVVISFGGTPHDGLVNAKLMIPSNTRKNAIPDYIREEYDAIKILSA